MEIEIETVFKAITEPILSSKTVHFQSNYTKTAFRMISVSNLLCDYLNFSGFLFLLQCADRSGWRAMNVMRKTEPEVECCWINWIEKVANKIKWIRSTDEENEEKRQWSCGLLMSLCDCLTRSCNSSSVQPISSLRSKKKKSLANNNRNVNIPNRAFASKQLAKRECALVVCQKRTRSTSTPIHIFHSYTLSQQQQQQQWLHYAM